MLHAHSTRLNMRRFRNQILSAMGVGPAASIVIALAIGGCGDSDKPTETDDPATDADGSDDADGTINADGVDDADGTDDADADDDTGSGDADADADGSGDADADADGGSDADGGPDGGEECTTPSGADGFYDCEGRCLNSDPYSSWLGDGVCDDGSRGVAFSCADLEWDNGDCEIPPDYDSDADADGGGDADADGGGGAITCRDVPDLTDSDWSSWEDPWPEEPFMVCQPLPAGGDWGTCPPMIEVDVWSLLYEHFVDPSSFGDAWGTVTCGPEEARDDACCYVIDDFEFWDIAVGRPFTVDGQARLAPTSEANGWSQTSEWMATGMTESQRDRLVAHWTETAQFEHASVASFARFTMQLMAVGAPADLIAESTRAQADEIRHARVCLGIASTLADETIGLGALNIDASLDSAGSVASILVDTIKEACVNETISAAICQASGEAATDAFIADALLSIAEDEQRHSTLAWRTVRWLLAEHPELADLARATFDEAMAQPWGSSTEATGDLTPWGVLSRAQEQAVANRVMRRVVKPCADALLGDAQPLEVSA
jgi:hypothetical protein